MKISGGCHCGLITYRAEIDPEGVRICHCLDCQTLSGSAFRATVPASEDDFELLSGSPKIYVKTGESGRQREQAFCADCGSPIYASSVGATSVGATSVGATSVGEGPRVIGLRLGSVRERDQLVPKKQYWCRSAVSWLADLDAIPKVEQQ